MSETCITSSSAATRGSDVLRNGLEAREDRVVLRRQRDDQRRERLGEAVRVESRRRRRAPWPTPDKLRRRLGRAADVRRRRRARRPARRFASAAVSARAVMSLEMAVRDFGQQKRRHGQITPASSRSLDDQLRHRLHLHAGLAPARLGGLQHLQRAARRRRRNRRASCRRSASSSPS